MADYLDQQFGNYRLVKLLGQGGFAEVYLGEHIHLGTNAAVKVLTTKLTDDETAHFRDEARTLIGLEHPHIIRVLDFGIQERIPFIIMAFAPYGSLRNRYPRGSRLPLPTIIAYVKQTARALQYVHDQKLIHRDIKPENMLIGRNKEILLSDFGIAAVAHSTRSLKTQDGSGTIYYMAPEQIQGKPRTASDQYSLGAVVYEWLSGIRPFTGTYWEITTQHLSTPPAPFDSALNIHPDVEQVVMQALAKDPKDRFPNVETFARVLAQVSQSTYRKIDNSPRSPVVPEHTKSHIPLPSRQLQQTLQPTKAVITSDKVKQPLNIWDDRRSNKMLFWALPLVGLSLFLIGSLTVWRSTPLYKPLPGFFLAFFGWSAYPLAFGLFVFACARFIEGIYNVHFIRMPLVIGLLILLLLTLAESQLIWQGTTGGIIGSLLAYPLHGWPVLVGHVLFIGLFIIVAILTCRSIFRQFPAFRSSMRRFVLFNRNR
jgi:serine/threonine protein kinase